MALTGRNFHIPILPSDFLHFETDFHNIRNNFDQEMRRMENEMSRFRNELEGWESKLLEDVNILSEDHHKEFSSWLEGMNSPLVEDNSNESGEDGKQLKLKFDVSQYKPEEIVVKTVDNKLLVHAKHEEKSDHHSVYREYNREFVLPKGTNHEAIKSSLSKDGILTVEAPLPALPAPAEHRIPIKQN